MDAPGCLGAFQFLRNELQAGTCRLIALCCHMPHATMKRRCPRSRSSSNSSLPSLQSKINKWELLRQRRNVCALTDELRLGIARIMLSLSRMEYL